VGKYGFITDENGKDIFISSSFSDMRLRKGECVDFTVATDSKGRVRAETIQRPTVTARPQSEQQDRYDETIDQEIEQFNAKNQAGYGHAASIDT